MSRSYSITRIALTVLLGLAVLSACFVADSGLAKPGHLGATAISSSIAVPAAAVGDGARSRLRLHNAALPKVALAYVTTVIASGTSPFPTRAGSPIDLFSLRVRI